MQYNSNCQKKSTPPDKHPTSRLFRSSLYWRIRCTDNFSDGLGGDAKGAALAHRYIQINDGARQPCLVFDIDRAASPGVQRLPAAYAWEEAGLPAPIVSGIQYEGHLVELLVHLFGDAWFHAGVLQAKYPRTVAAGDVVQPRARVTSRSVDGGNIVYGLEVWCQRPDNEKVLVGTARCALSADA